MISSSLIPAEEVESVSIWIPIVKAYRYETIHTEKQETKCLSTLEACRHLFNWALGERKEGWENGKWNVGYKDQQDYLKTLRNGLGKRLSKEEIELGKELQNVYEQVLQNVLNRVEFGYQRFFERCQNNKNNPKKYKKPGHTRFKSRNRMKSFAFPQYGNGCQIVNEKGDKDDKGDTIRLSKIGDIKFIKHEEIGDPGIPFLIKTVTMKKEVDKWIVIFTIDTFIELKIRHDIYNKLDLKPLNSLIYSLLEAKRNKNKIHEKIKKELKDLLDQISKLSGEQCKEKANDEGKNIKIETIEDLQKELDILNQKYVGNDMGLPNLMTDSNGKKTKAPEYLDKSLKRLRKEQQKLARKKKYDVFEVEKDSETVGDSKMLSKEITKKDKNGKEIVKSVSQLKLITVKRDPKTNKRIWKGSKNRDKQVEKVAKVHRYIANQRRNYGHIISKGKVKDNDLNVFEKLPIQKMMKNRRFSKRIADASWGQVQRFTKYKAEWAGKMVDFIDPAYTSQACSRCGRLVGKTEGQIFHDSVCGLTTNIHIGAGKNIRNRSPTYQQKLDDIYRRLSHEMKGLIHSSEKKLRDNIYCWSLDPEDSWTDDPSKIIGRDAAARIYAFGEVTSTHTEMCEQAASWNKEATPKEGDDVSKVSSIQAAPFRAR